MWSRRRGTACAILAVALVTSLAACTSADDAPSPTRAAATIAVTSSVPAFGDRGPGEYARGTARLLSSGDYLYTVASGDTAGGIARRFGSTPEQVSGGSRGGLEIFAGDVLRFGPAPGAPRSTTSPAEQR
jgi:hypothetical protein